LDPHLREGIVTRLVRRNYGRGHGYKLDGEKIVGVTTALGVLDKPALRDWIARTVAARAVDEWDELALMPVTERLERIRWGARDVVQAAALRGTQIHDLGQKLAEGGEVDVPDEHRGPVEAYARWLDRWDVTPWAAETPLASTQHKYGGTADLWAQVGKLGGEPFLLDIKTGKGVYTETAWQLAAYRFADLLIADGEEVSVPDVSGVYVAHVLPDDVRMLPVEAGPREWRSFLYILQTYREVQAAEEWPLIGSAVQPDQVAVS
jgi:hypothetical protein